MKLRTKIGFAIISIPILSYFGFLYLGAGWPFPYYYNNYKLHTLLNELKEIDLPRNSKIINTSKNLGIYWGNSNHCDAIAMVLIESDVDGKDFFDVVYENTDIDYPDYGYNPFQIFVYNGKKIHYKEMEIGQNSYDQGDKCKNCDQVYNMEIREIEDMYKLVNNISGYEEEKNYYILRATNQFNFKYNDMRCN